MESSSSSASAKSATCPAEFSNSAGSTSAVWLWGEGTAGGESSACDDCYMQKFWKVSALAQLVHEIRLGH